VTTLPELQRLLVQGAQREEERAQGERMRAPREEERARREEERMRRGIRGRVRRLRAPALALGGLLATTTIALAATGVILTGAPVRPSGPANPDAGDGVPLPGASRLLALRVPDPEGGLPWGMRIVRTTRGEVCLQVGRVENGELGELGIDGAFGDDGRFHPIPAQALPRDYFHDRFFDNVSSATASCQLAGQVSAGEHIGVESSAAEETEIARSPSDGSRDVAPLSELRDIYYGILGRNAVSISYEMGGHERSEMVAPGTGAYLIVRRTGRGEQVGTGGASLGSEGELDPAVRDGLTAITYRIDGRLCQHATVGWQHLADPCPARRWPQERTSITDLHRTVHARLRLRDHLVEGAQLSFTAPFAVTSAGADYRIEIAVPNAAASCSPAAITHARRVHDLGAVLISLERDVARGATISQWIAAPELFVFGTCGRETAVRRSAKIVVRYGSALGGPTVIVGSITVRMPPHTRLAPAP
jgi:hypothetical protein